MSPLKREFQGSVYSERVYFSDTESRDLVHSFASSEGISEVGLLNLTAALQTQHRNFMPMMHLAGQLSFERNGEKRIRALQLSDVLAGLSSKCASVCMFIRAPVFPMVNQLLQKKSITATQAAFLKRETPLFHSLWKTATSRCGGLWPPELIPFLEELAMIAKNTLFSHRNNHEPFSKCPSSPFTELLETGCYFPAIR